MLARLSRLVDPKSGLSHVARGIAVLSSSETCRFGTVTTDFHAAPSARLILRGVEKQPATAGLAALPHASPFRGRQKADRSIDDRPQRTVRTGRHIAREKNEF